MMQYRAVRLPNDTYWHIECFDAEFQVAYKHIEWVEDKDKFATQKFVSKAAAERFIRDSLFNNDKDAGEVGEWIRGSI